MHGPSFPVVIYHNVSFCDFFRTNIMFVKFGTDLGLPYLFYVSVRKIPKYAV